MVIRRFVIDTSLFVNPHARDKFGKTPNAAMLNFISKIKKLNSDFFIPPSVFNELKNFIKPAIVEKCEPFIKRRAPNLYSTFVPAAILHSFVEDVRKRINKGLRLAEEYATDNRPENDEKLKKLREKYRDAMRAGLVDSTEDFELILLAKELDAVVVSADEGILGFATKLGCECINASKFHSVLKTLK